MRRKKDRSNGITALYERLSRDDDNAGESNSIVHEIEITVFSRYIDKNTYLKVQYLPHTKYGAIVEIK